jgi:hypothetical protein
MTGGDSALTRDPPVGVETTSSHDITVCDVALVSHCTGTIDRDAVCGMLIECSQDVTFVVFTLHLLVIYYLVFYFRLSLQ